MSLQVKICGIRDAATARLAAGLGAACLGFIAYPGSPRYLSLEEFRRMAPELPPVPKIYVQVKPDPEELAEVMSDFDQFQLHFPVETPVETIAAWSTLVSPERLWLAPRLHPGADFPQNLLGMADSFLVDTCRPGLYGGTGETGDWKSFAALRQRWPVKRWILAGGLSPDNVVDAVRKTGTGWIDVNSGVESAPGLKDADKLRRLFEQIRLLRERTEA